MILHRIEKLRLNKRVRNFTPIFIASFFDNIRLLSEDLYYLEMSHAKIAFN